ncbi:MULTISPECIES: glucose 1-dehydrogenase [unclassified Nocardioides]|uniref:glucose 1-dehydrogenase n=1 Tax=unclassified Nocardioides TaxID=2615069 RepID=UPI0006FDB6FE|nr:MULTISPECIES: glucose 1-dehydrogenase [unclassified Nocardioides]KRA37613.1 oxidoreductase [Nocardioides sp. Root614]KRA91574.1 oxidoreductase [Nocardioides sp. Root682]
MTAPVAIVTGSAKGIGLSIARELTGRGYRVVVSDINASDAEVAAKELDGAIAVPCDVRDEDQVKALVADTVAHHGRLDLMVPNAGIGIVSPILETDLATWRQVTSVNLDGVFLSLRWAAPAIIASGGGSIVNLASVSGTTGTPLIASYAAAKAAVINLTKTAAMELRPHGVRVNAVLPGFIGTDLVSDAAPEFERHLGLEAGAFGQVIEAKQGRFGAPDDVARAVAFLADAEQTWVTGTAFTLDGGLTSSLI